MPGGKTDKDKNCQYCGKSFNIRGIVRHEKACKAQSESAARDARYAAALADQRAKQSRHQQGMHSIQYNKIFILILL